VKDIQFEPPSGAKIRSGLDGSSVGGFAVPAVDESQLRIAFRSHQRTPATRGDDEGDGR
jgi:hypothetical protein